MHLLLLNYQSYRMNLKYRQNLKILKYLLYH
jgi:hypothetical protein